MATPCIQDEVGYDRLPLKAGLLRGKVELNDKAPYHEACQSTMGDTNTCTRYGGDVCGWSHHINTDHTVQFRSSWLHYQGMRKNLSKSHWKL